jgi:hypothetical protein
VRLKFEQSYGKDFSQTKIHSSQTAAALANSLGARAFATGNHIIFGKNQYQPHNYQGQHIIGHELAHIAQQDGANIIRRYSSLRIGRPDSLAEREANQASKAALAGKSFTPSISDEADIQTFPWLVLGIALAFAGGVAIGSSSWGGGPTLEENRAAAETDPDRLINTGWVYVPAVGPLIQIVQARSGLERGLGILFFGLDIATAGMAGTAVLKLSQVGLRALRGASAATVRELTEAGMRSVSQAEADQLVRGALSSGQAVAATEGALNHAVIYVMNDSGQIVRLHGGISRLLYTSGTTYSQAAFRTGAINTFQVVGEQGANLTLLEASRTLQQGTGLMLRSCGATQCLLLERAGLGSLVPASYSGRFIPASVTAHMALQSPVQVVNGVRFATGTLIQESLLMGGSTLVSRAGNLVVTASFTPDVVPGFSPLASSTSPSQQEHSDDLLQVRARAIYRRYGANPQGEQLADLLRHSNEFIVPLDIGNPQTLQSFRSALLGQGITPEVTDTFLRHISGID